MNKLNSFVFLVAIIMFNSCSASQKTVNKNIKANDILSDIAKGKNITLKDKIIEGNLDFSTLNSVFLSQATQLVYVNSAINFINCTFKGKIIAQKRSEKIATVTDFAKNLGFINCTFEKELNFDQAIFRSQISFNQSKFKKSVFMRGAEFRSSKNFFIEIHAFDNFLLTNSKFYGNANFMKSVFEKQFSIQKIVVNNDFFLGACKFLSYTDLSGATFSGYCDFKYSEFTNRLVLSNAVFRGKLNLADAVLTEQTEARKVDFQKEIVFSKNKTIPEKVIFNNCIFRLYHKKDLEGIVSVQNCLFTN